MQGARDEGCGTYTGRRDAVDVNEIDDTDGRTSGREGREDFGRLRHAYM